MPTTDELIAGLQSRILALEQTLEEIKARPQTPDATAELKAVKAELAEVRKELAETKKSQKKEQEPPPAPKPTEGEGNDPSSGFF